MNYFRKKWAERIMNVNGWNFDGFFKANGNWVTYRVERVENIWVVELVMMLCDGQCVQSRNFLEILHHFIRFFWGILFFWMSKVPDWIEIENL